MLFPVMVSVVVSVVAGAPGSAEHGAIDQLAVSDRLNAINSVDAWRI